MAEQPAPHDDTSNPNAEALRVVVLGAGFGGLELTTRLSEAEPRSARPA